MPTPESESFKAQKPTVPPTFDGVDYDDNKALKAAQDSIIREQWVQSMMARLIREEMGKCYRREGVNHLENCGHLRGTSTPYEASVCVCFGCRYTDSQFRAISGAAEVLQSPRLPVSATKLHRQEGRASVT